MGAARLSPPFTDRNEHMTPPGIAYYISSHGYGHAARQQPIIKQLAARDIPLTVRTAAPPKFFTHPGVAYHGQHYDIGLIQKDALTIDVDATYAWYRRFLDNQPDLVKTETAFIRENNIGLIVTDMPPVACEIAAAAGIPSVAVTHFTWDWVYGLYVEPYPQFGPIVESIRESYGKAEKVLAMPFAHELDMFVQEEPIPLVVNAVTKSREAVYAEMNIDPGQRLALLSMGGMDQAAMDLSRLRDMDSWAFLMMPAVWEQVRDLPNTRPIPMDYPNYHNLIAAADVLVGKAGWSTVAECIAHKTPMIYTIRDDYRENVLLDAALRQYANSHFIPRPEFEAGAWCDHIEPLAGRDFTWPEIATNGASVAAEHLAAYVV